MAKKNLGIKYAAFTKEYTNVTHEKVDAWYCHGERNKGICVALPNLDDGRIQEVYITNAQMAKLGYVRKDK